MVSGSFVVEDVDGNPYTIEGEAFLCRCGASHTKPFCDGSHKAAGFESAPHVGDEGCAVERLVEPARLASFRKLLVELETT